MSRSKSKTESTKETQRAADQASALSAEAPAADDAPTEVTPAAQQEEQEAAVATDIDSSSPSGSNDSSTQSEQRGPVNSPEVVDAEFQRVENGSAPGASEISPAGNGASPPVNGTDVPGDNGAGANPPAPSDPQELHDYVVISPLDHDNVRYEIGARVQLAKAHADPILGRAVTPAQD